MAGTKTKAADRSASIKKLLPAIKKQYKVASPKGGRSVLETMLYAVCLEDASVEQSELWYTRIFTEFPDLNEARVSSVYELERIFDNSPDADWRAFRIRNILQYIFEKNYSFEFEALRKKTLDLAVKQLAKIRHATPFVRAFTLQETLGAHLLPLDDSSTKALVWLGLASHGQPAEEVSEALRAVVRKAEAEPFCSSIRAVATDLKINAAFAHNGEAEGFDASDATERLADLWKHGPAAVKPKSKPAAAEAKPAKATATKTAAPKKDKPAAGKAKAPPAAAKTPKKKAASTTAAVKKVTKKTK